MGQLTLPPHYVHLSEGALFNHLLFEADQLRINPARKQIALTRLKWLMERLIQLGIKKGIIPLLSPIHPS